jgi:hypothetical protein
MSWLARLDDRARAWPLAVRLGYWALKWYLAAVGAFLLLMYYTHRLGLPSLWMD